MKLKPALKRVRRQIQFYMYILINRERKLWNK